MSWRLTPSPDLNLPQLLVLTCQLSGGCMVANVSNDLYRFACQVRAGEQVDVRTIRCVDVKEAIAFAERLAQCPLTDTAFSEIHKFNGFGGVQVVWSDKEKNWPTDAK